MKDMNCPNCNKEITWIDAKNIIYLRLTKYEAKEPIYVLSVYCPNCTGYFKINILKFEVK